MEVTQWANIKLASVVTDITGVSAQSMLKALAEGQHDAKVLATSAKGSLVRKQIELEKALQGQVREHHRFLIASHLTHLEFLDNYLDTRQQDRLLQHLCHRATTLGYQVQLTPMPQPTSET
jgi:hypothetical protein